MSFFSKDLYRDVSSQWKGTGFAYLLLLLAICWIFPITRMHADLAYFVDNEAPKIISQIPTISIVDGNASIQESQPYYIKDPETGEVLVIIDTTGKITSLAETKALALVTKTETMFKKSEIETRTFSFANIKEFTLDQEKITGWLTVAKKLAVPVLYPLAVLGSYAFRIIQVLVYAAIGMLFASWFKSRRPYISLIRLSVVAVTPCIIIRTVLGALHVNIPFAGLWYFLTAMGYLFFGVRATSKDEGVTTESN